MKCILSTLCALLLAVPAMAGNVKLDIQNVPVSVTQKCITITWQADPKIALSNQTFYIYSSTNGPFETVGWNLFPTLPLSVVDTNRLMEFTNWPQIATVTGTNKYVCPMTETQRFFAVRAYRNGLLSGWATGN